MARSDSAIEAIATFKALIRYELKLRPAADAVSELESRLHPQSPSERPPTTAPAIKRLTRAAADLRAGRVPAGTIEQFTLDLRVLNLFAPDDSMGTPGLERLLADVEAVPAPKRKPRSKTAARPNLAALPPHGTPE